MEVLENAIKYHDPDNNWPTFKGQLSIRMESPGKSDRVSQVILDIPARYFELRASRDSVATTHILSRTACELRLNGTDKFTEEEANKNGLSCDRAKTMKNYYTYLYGLPMKLKDPGTIIDPDVIIKKFKGKEYIVLKVTYKKSVGGDTWYFYFDPLTSAMELYQFYHDESKNDGEYILLSGLETISGIKMPKTRAWYYNKDDKYLGTDILTRAQPIK